MAGIDTQDQRQSLVERLLNSNPYKGSEFEDRVRHLRLISMRHNRVAIIALCNLAQGKSADDIRKHEMNHDAAFAAQEKVLTWVEGLKDLKNSEEYLLWLAFQLNVLDKKTASLLGKYYATEKQNIPQSLNFYMRAYELDPSDVRTLDGIARAHAALKDDQSAGFWNDRLLAVAPNDPDGLVRKARNLLRLQKNNDAEIAARLAVRVSEQTSGEASLTARAHLSLALLRQKEKVEEGRDIAEKILRQEPEHRELLWNLAKSYALQGESGYQQARQYLARLISTKERTLDWRSLVAFMAITPSDHELYKLLVPRLISLGLKPEELDVALKEARQFKWFLDADGMPTE